MTGDIPDIHARLRSLLPPWWPNIGASPVLDGILVGTATLFSASYELIQYAGAQARILTSSGGWLDLIAWDFFGGRFTRIAGETDAAFDARIIQELVRPRVTRAAIKSAVEQLTGNPVRIIEPSKLTDVGFWKKRGSGAAISYWNVDGSGTPLRWSGRGLHNQFFIECTLPLTPAFGGNPMPTWGKYTLNWMKRGTAGALTSGSAMILRYNTIGQRGSDAVYALINAMRAAGVIAWVRFVPLPTVPRWDQPGATWDQPGAVWDSTQ